MKDEFDSTIQEVEKSITKLTKRNKIIHDKIKDRKSSILSEEEVNDLQSKLKEIKKELDVMEVDKQWKIHQEEAIRIVKTLQNEVNRVVRKKKTFFPLFYRNNLNIN